MATNILRRYLVQCACGLLILGASAGAAYSQGPGRYFKEASDRLAPLIDKAAKDGYSFPPNAFTFGGSFIKKDTNSWVPVYTVQLVEGRTYVFLAAGDNDTRDLDIDIQDAAGKTLVSDTDTAAEAVVTFTPRVSGRYTVRLRLYDSEQGLPCYCFAAMMSKN
jgi:hypothetical protein